MCFDRATEYGSHATMVATHVYIDVFAYCINVSLILLLQQQVLAVSAATSVHVWDVESNKRLSGESKTKERSIS